MDLKDSTYSTYELTYKKDLLPVWLAEALSRIFPGLGDPPITFDEVMGLAIPTASNRHSTVAALKPGRIEALPPPNAKAAAAMDIPSRSSMPRDLPIYGTAAGSAGDGAFFINFGDVVDRAYRPPSLTGNTLAYGVYVDGDSMAPAYEHGGLAVADPARKVRPGDRVLVVVMTDDNDDAERMAYIKEFQRQTSETLFLRQYNPPMDIEIPVARVVPRSIHRLLTIAELMGLG